MFYQIMLTNMQHIRHIQIDGLIILGITSLIPGIASSSWEIIIRCNAGYKLYRNYEVWFSLSLLIKSVCHTFEFRLTSSFTYLIPASETIYFSYTNYLRDVLLFIDTRQRSGTNGLLGIFQAILTDITIHYQTYAKEQYCNILKHTPISLPNLSCSFSKLGWWKDCYSSDYIVVEPYKQNWLNYYLGFSQTRWPFFFGLFFFTNGP